MDREMININGNIVGKIKRSEIQTKNNGMVEVANFTVIRKIKENESKKREYIYCNLFGDKISELENLVDGDYIHIFGYFKNVEKKGKKYKNFIVKHINKLEKEEKIENKED
ncbi:MAG: single-stranded DNA-binding protein [Tissierellia bacterium]|nr:single-stranded DNA-binding protein [Tissierellia bacterium]